MLTRTMMDGGNGSRLSPEALERALFDVEDLLQRVMCPFVLLGETARSIIEDGALAGEKVEIGVRKLDLPETSLRTIRSFTFDSFKETENSLDYISNGVPVHVKIIHKKWAYLENPDFVFYKAGEFKIPNPFDLYYKSRFFVR